MKLNAALLAGIIIALFINAAMLVRIERALPLPVSGAVASSPAPVANPSMAMSVNADDHAKQDSATILAALAVVRRHQDDNGAEAQLARVLLDVDPNAYFADLTALVKAGNNRAVQRLYHADTDSSDRRYIPILLMHGQRALDKGNANELMLLAGLASRFDDPGLRPLIVGAVQQWLKQGSIGDYYDARTVRTLMYSGLPAAHVEIFRWFGRNDHWDQERQRLYLQIRDMYESVRKLPAIKVDRANNGKPSDSDLSVFRETEEWIRDNRRLLVYDPALQVMTLAKDSGGAAQRSTGNEPPATSDPAPVPAPVSPKSEF